MAAEFTKAELAAMERAGDAEEVSRRINAYSAAVERMLHRLDELTGEYPGHWAALHEDEFIVTKVSLEDLFRLCDERGFKRENLVIRYLEAEKTVRIL